MYEESAGVRRFKIAKVGVGFCLLAIAAYSVGHPRSSQAAPIDHSRYKVFSCQDTDALIKDSLDHHGTMYEQEQRESMKTDCDIVLNGSGTPALYMGRDHLGRHLVLMKTPQ